MQTYVISLNILIYLNGWDVLDSQAMAAFGGAEPPKLSLCLPHLSSHIHNASRGTQYQPLPPVCHTANASFRKKLLST